MRLGPYEILSALGAGGMGEVYRARDAKLNRDVAIKVLLPAVANDPDRLARFGREAQVLASLNHPNIAHIYGVEESGGARALVMELVEGPTLADRIAQGPIPLDEALPIAKQIAEALETAHEQGIIHRDLKPANVKVRADATVKVLDFGLAKAMDPAASSATAMSSPTLSMQATQAGIILGTAAYMSPEQAKGRAADKRSDVWAFGAVLYEMLSGERAFKGEDISDTLAAVLRQDVDWTALPTSLPTSVRRLMARCLDRDVKRRLRDIGEARIVLEDPAAHILGDAGGVSALAPPQQLWRRALPFAITMLVASALGGAAVWTLRPSAAPAVVRFAFALPRDQTLTAPGRSQIAISPDGTKIAYVANFRLYLRTMSDLTARPIPGADSGEAGKTTGGTTGVTSPAFSPDGQFVAFFSAADNTLKKISISGGAAATLCPATNVYGLSWRDTGIVFGQGAGGIMRVSPNGGTPQTLINVQAEEVAHGPEILPDGHSLLMTLATGNNPDRWDKGRIVVQSLNSGERRVLVEGGSDARYSPTGHLVFARGGVAFAVPFDLGRMETTGDPVPVVEGVRRATPTGTAQLSFSSSGSLTYIPGPVSVSDQQDLAWVDRAGVAERLKLPAGSYQHVRISPDGKHLTFGTDDGKDANVHVYAPGSGTSIRRLTFGANNRFPIWAARGTRIAFQSDREGDRGIFWQPVDGGTAERLTKAEEGTSHVPEAWTPAGDRLLYTVTRGSTVTLWTLSLKEKTNERVGALESSAPIGAVFSPDGQWIAYAIDNTVYVQPFPPTGSQYQLSRTNAGHHPIWSGGEVFYEPTQFQFVAVPVQTRASFIFGNPVSWPGSYGSRQHMSTRNRDIAPDGKRFIAPVPVDTESVQEIRVVLNWFEDLKRLPTK